MSVVQRKINEETASPRAMAYAEPLVEGWAGVVASGGSVVGGGGDGVTPLHGRAQESGTTMLHIDTWHISTRTSPSLSN